MVRAITDKEAYLGMILRDKQKEYNAEKSVHKQFILFQQIKQLQKAIEFIEEEGADTLIRIDKRIEQMEQKFSRIEEYISENIPMRVSQGGESLLNNNVVSK